MTVNLTQRQRLLAAAIYLSLLWILYNRTLDNVQGSEAHALFWFYSGALMIILGRYVVEPFFTSPADAIVNALALLISLTALSQPDRDLLLGYRYIEYYAYAAMAVATLAIALKDTQRRPLKIAARLAFKVAEITGKSQLMFSVVYLSSSYSFFANELGVFVSALTLWVCITFFDVAGKTIHEISKVITWLRSGVGDELGRAIGCENPLHYTVEVDHTTHQGGEPNYGDIVAIETKNNVGSVGMVVARKQLVGKSWLSVYLLTNDEGAVLKFDLRKKKVIDDPQSVFSAENRAYTLSLEKDFEPADKQLVLSNPLFAYRKSFVGYITRDSNINTVSFVILRDRDATNREIAEGTILKAEIYGEDTLYQVVNGNTREERLQALDSHGFTVGIARKLGKYDHNNSELNIRKWMPNIYCPLFFGFEGEVSAQRIAQLAQTAIGRLPETDLEIRIKDLDAIVTHNTAILGILGIGKSCLAFELIKKIVAAGVKVICIDITNQYRAPNGLPAYLSADSIAPDLSDQIKTTLRQSKAAASKRIEGNPTASGNGADYKTALNEDLAAFMNSAAMVKIYNPDLHPVSKGVSFKNTTLEDLSVAEKTRIIAERLFVYAQDHGESATARYLLVFEEAHSLVPEWNSVSNAGDDHATNGTAKVILQGRKYGLGSLTITQRTANVSKSILNQCNTVFAMRVFDDTGKGFLENYIGSDYANTLPTLDERHAIATGKGLRLKQPVIIQLNDRSNFLAAAAAPVVAAAAPDVEAPEG